MSGGPHEWNAGLIWWRVGSMTPHLRHLEDLGEELLLLREAAREVDVLRDVLVRIQRVDVADLPRVGLIGVRQ